MNHLNSSKIEIIGKWYEVQQDSPKNASTYSAQRLEATGCDRCVEIVFYSILWGSNSDSIHVKCGLLAQQPHRKCAESLPHILLPRSGHSLQKQTDLLRGLAHSTGDCAVNSDSIRATLVSAEVPGTG